MRSDQLYLSLDLELDKGDVIEVGVVLGSASSPSDTWVRRSWLVKPRHGQPLDQNIIELTGITQSDIDRHGVDHHQLKPELVSLIDQHKPFVNPVQWGLGDAQELLAELNDVTGAPAPVFGRRVIDVKHHYLFIEAACGRSLSGGLRRAMARHGLEFTGRPHRAVDDAFNTLRFYFHLLNRQHHLESFLTWSKSCKP
jgi:inhibitor of KinA sporulation pathway (predicted exonuclease)